MTYKVLKAFHDLTDSRATKSGKIYHFYQVGDEYPRKGLNPKPERIEELTGKENAQNTPLIAPIFDMADHMTPPDEQANEAVETPPKATPKKKRTTRKKKETSKELMPGA